MTKKLNYVHKYATQCVKNRKKYGFNLLRYLNQVKSHL